MKWKQLGFRGLLFGLITIVLMFNSIDSFADRDDVEAFVTRFYQQCLGRSPDQEGLNYWTDSLLDGSRTGADVASGFVFSDEFINQAVEDRNYLDIL